MKYFKLAFEHNYPFVISSFKYQSQDILLFPNMFSLNLSQMVWLVHTMSELCSASVQHMHVTGDCTVYIYLHKCSLNI